MSQPPLLAVVRLHQLPVPVWSRSQQHVDELLREFALLAEQLHDDVDAAAALPRRLVQLVEELTASYGGFGEDAETRLFAAAAAGEQTLDELVYRLPPQAAVAARHLSEILDEADDYCRAGRHLLTLATPPELVRFRRWFLGEFERQIVDRQPPLPWPAYAPSG